MNKNTVGILVTVVAVLAVVGVVAANRTSQTDTSENSQSSTSSPNSKSDTPGASSGTSTAGSQPNQDDKSSDAKQDLTGQTEVSMDIKDFGFAQKDITIKKGTKVTWTNRDSAKHNAFSDDAKGPQGKLLAMGESYSFTFNAVGAVNYYCEPHPYMKAVVNVIE